MSVEPGGRPRGILERARRGYPRAQVPSGAAIVAAVVVVGACLLLLAVADTLPIFIIGLLVAFLLDPVVTWLAAHRVPRGLASLLALVGLALVLAILVGVFLETVLTQAAAFVATLPEAFAQLTVWVEQSSLPAAAKEDILAFFASLEQAALEFDVTSLFAPILEGLLALLGAFFTLLVLPFFIFFVLAGRPGLEQALARNLPEPWARDVHTVNRTVISSFGTYFKAEAIVATILAVLVFVSLMAFSVLIDPAFAEVALILALIAGFSEFIPNLGPWIAAIPAVLFALTVSPLAVVATILLYLVVMFLEGQVLVPKIEGGAFSFHPALVLFLVVAGIALAGIMGAILALPVTAAAWRVSRYAFRRASGLSPDEAIAFIREADTAPAGDEPGAPVATAGTA